MLANTLPKPILFTTSALVVAATVLIPLLRRFGKRKYIDKPENVAKRVRATEDGGGIGSDVPEYDIICIGGGTSGCVLASRLSEDPKTKVLLLEAGESGVALAFSRVPAAFNQFMKSKHDFQLWTVPQDHCVGKVKFWPRPRLLGGCSSVNAMMFHQGAPEDYDEWATIMKGQDGAEGWKYINFKKYFLKFEMFSPHPNYPHVDSSLRGVDGPMQIGYFGNFTKIVSKFVAACQNVGIEPSHDVNTISGTLGVTKIMTYIDSKGRRSSTESAYLTPEVLRRPNLKVVTNASVTRILLDNTLGRKRAVGVEFAFTPNGPRYRAAARKEIILSAGAVHTPHILMLSGVGPASHLSRHGIPIIHDLPGVGQNLMDHPVVHVRLRSTTGEALNFLNPNTWSGRIRRVIPILQWLWFGSGPLSSNLGEAAAFLRVSDPTIFNRTQFPDRVEEVASGPGAPDLELFTCPAGYIDHGFGEVPKGDLITMSALLLRPLSKGSLSLRSADSFEPPIIDPRYLEATNDVKVLLRGMRLMLRVAQTEPLASFLTSTDTDPRLDHELHKLDDDELEKVVRERCESAYHPTSSARMAPLAQGGVVDGYLRVYGIENLRIADASVFPTITSGHTAAPCIAIAERLADLIKAEHLAN